MAKYGNRKTTVNGIRFDSLHEAERYSQLLLLLRAGKISDLELQKEYELIPAQWEDVPTGGVYTRGARKGEPRTRKVCLEKAVKYVADFVYTENGNTVVEDAKGVRTKEYTIKRKLMLYIHKIRISEV